MKTYLILSEKKSLAKAIADGVALAISGKVKQAKDYYEVVSKNAKAYVLYLFGHILEVDLEKTFGDRKNIKLSLKENEIKYKVKKGRYKLFKTIKKFLEDFKKGKIDYLVIASDPDREGELLAREVLHYLGINSNDKRVYRLWFSSLEKTHIAKCFKKLEQAIKFYSLYKQGFYRMYFDLLVGINGSRILQMAKNSYNLSLGRVQTPTLYLIYKREKEIENFKPKPYFVLSAILEKDKIKFKASKKVEKEKEAKNLLSYLKSKKTLKVEKIEQKKEVVRPPTLPDLASLQITVGKRFKLSASQILKHLQEMYEAKVITYPRTESKFLHENDIEFYKQGLIALNRKDKIKDIEKYKKRFVNNRDVEEKGHPAILIINPLEKMGKFNKIHKALYDEIAKRMLANLEDDALLLRTTITFEKDLKAKGKTILKEGFLKVYKEALEEEKEKQKEDEAQNKFLPKLEKGEEVKKISEKMEKRFTKPPERYTSSSLISTLKKLGLGTQATRHMFEEVLLKRGYIRKDKKGKIYLTDLGRELIENLLQKKARLIDIKLTSELEKELQKEPEKVKGKIKDLIEELKNVFL